MKRRVGGEGAGMTPAKFEILEVAMRIAAVATIVTALSAAPFVAAAVGANMTEHQFVSAARCVAFENVEAAEADPAQTAELRARLAFEQHAQPSAVVQEARAEMRNVWQDAAREDAQARQAARRAACGDAAPGYAQRGDDGPA